MRKYAIGSKVQRYGMTCVDFFLRKEPKCVLQIVLPTGAVVMVMNGRKRTSQFINVKFKASAADYGNTEGRLNSGEEDLVAFISFFVCLQCGIRFLIYIY